jgi:hypothetical protein
VSNTRPFVDTAGDLVPLSAERNCRPFGDKADQASYGTRPGMRKVYSTRLGVDGNRAVRTLAQISRASAVTSFTLGAKTDIDPGTATPRRSALLVANVAILNTATRAIREIHTVSGSGGQARVQPGGYPATPISIPAAPSGFPNVGVPAWVAVHPSGSLAAVAFNYTASSQVRCLLVFIDPVTGMYVGSKLIAPSVEAVGSVNNTSAVAFAWTNEALWVGRGRELWYVPTPTLGTRASLANPEVVSAALSIPPAVGGVGRFVALSTATVNGETIVWAAFDGTTEPMILTNPSATVADPTCAKHMRAGIVPLVQRPDVAELSYKLEPRALSTAPSLSDQNVEVSTTGDVVIHGTIRFSQTLFRAPRGALPTAVAINPVDASCVVAFTNQGYGPDPSTHPPDGSVGYTTVAKYEISGAQVWEIDTGSPIGTEQGGKRAGIGTYYPCDVPDEDGANAGTTNANGPAIRALACDRAGRVFAAGRISQSRANVFALGSASGVLLWRSATESNNPTSSSPTWATPGALNGGTPTNGIGIDAADQSVIVVGRRNGTWLDLDNPPTGKAAILWSINPATGLIQWGHTPIEDYTAGSPPDYTPLTAPKGVAVGTGVAVYAMTTVTDT